MINFITSNELATAMVVLPLAIIAKNLVGAGHGYQKDEYDWQILKQGLFKGILIYAGIGVLVLIALLSSDITVLVGGVDLGIVEALIVVIGGASLVYIVDIFTLLGKIWKQPSQEEKEADVE